jgi:hypothetical protein
MSYSRWGDSDWYTFWQDSKCDTKEDEVLALWLSIDKTYNFNYKELTNFTSESIMELYDVSQELADEAMGYIKCFLEDVDEEYAGERTN